ncbi:hypothetical protein KDK95_16325 [Actinospica sp. MGRD01-02]|uniref:Uncharacterized protein n=1 Tax=Actinospica acidithermotolerans TaxID=2828514 RepID=A0A941EAC1_9ACTN|nr:hypothetical protein [Actinospica acidithermotolerans]MBR7827886.1 hypothetical protein [Actinospica acidithermotolerans]
MASIQGGLLLTQVRRDPQQLRIAADAALAHLRAQGKLQAANEDDALAAADH